MNNTDKTVSLLKRNLFILFPHAFLHTLLCFGALLTIGLTYFVSFYVDYIVMKKLRAHPLAKDLKDEDFLWLPMAFLSIFFLIVSPGFFIMTMALMTGSKIDSSDPATPLGVFGIVFVFLLILISTLVYYSPIINSSSILSGKGRKEILLSKRSLHYLFIPVVTAFIGMFIFFLAGFVFASVH